MFRAVVTKLYDPETSSLTQHFDNKKTYGNVCFSSFHYNNDITSHIKISKSSSIHGNSLHPPIMAHNGIFTKYSYHIFHSNRQNKNWFEAEFDQLVTVTEVVVKNRDDSRYGVHFGHIEFRMSNSTLDFATPILYYLSHWTTRGAVTRNPFSTPGIGRFLLLRCLKDNAYLLLGEMIVIGHVV